MDPAARAYFQQVEEHYQRIVGRPLILSPKDVEAVREWWEKGVPIDCAIRGLTLYIERISQDPRKRKRRLAVRYAVNDVLNCAEDLRTSRVGDRRGEDVEDAGRLRTVFRSLADRLRDSDVVPVVADIIDRVQALEKRFESEELSPSEIEEQLEAWDRELLEAVRGSLGQEPLAKIRKEAEARLSDARARMEEAAWDKTVGLLEERLLREQTGIPRLSLYAY